MSSGHPASFQGPQLPPPTQQQIALPPGSQVPPPASNVNGLCAQPSLPPMARPDGIPGPVPPNPNLQQLSGQPPGPGYHPQQGKEGSLLGNWKQNVHGESLVELQPFMVDVLSSDLEKWKFDPLLVEWKDLHCQSVHSGQAFAYAFTQKFSTLLRL